MFTIVQNQIKPNFINYLVIALTKAKCHSYILFLHSSQLVKHMILWLHHRTIKETNFSILNPNSVHFFSEGLQDKATLCLHLFVSLSLYVATLKEELHRTLWPNSALHKESSSHLLGVLSLQRGNAEQCWLAFAGVKVINSNQKPKLIRTSYKSFERSFSPVQRRVF